MANVTQTRLGALGVAATSLALLAGCADALQNPPSTAPETEAGPDFPDMTVTLMPGGEETTITALWQFFGKVLGWLEQLDALGQSVPAEEVAP